MSQQRDAAGWLTLAAMRALLWSIVLVIACDRGHPRDQAPPPPPVVPAPATPSCTLAPLPLRLPAPRRLVAIGDLHGDLGGTRAALRTAGAIDDRDHWSGGELVVVQTGDVLDRGDDERAILDLIARLEGEARAAGGAFIMLLGNHELMNAAGDYRYVTPGGMHAFDDVAISSPAAAGVSAPWKQRAGALGPGGLYGKQLARHAVVAIIGDTVFSHAGVLGSWVARVDDLNQPSRCWLDGQAGEPPQVLRFDDSPVWTRAAGIPSVDCVALSSALDDLRASRMVVGHTVQSGGITSACNDMLWRIDVGLAKLYDGPIQVLELVPGKPPRILEGTR